MSFTLNVYFCLFNKKCTALKIGHLKKYSYFQLYLTVKNLIFNDQIVLD